MGEERERWGGGEWAAEEGLVGGCGDRLGIQLGSWKRKKKNEKRRGTEGGGRGGGENGGGEETGRRRGDEF